jgi:CBS domain-containing protein
MNLHEMFQSEVVTACPEDKVRDLTEKMNHENVGAVVIVENERVVGIVTDRDLAMKLGLGDATPDTIAKEIMTTDVVTIWDDQGLFNATQYLLGHKVRRLPIIDRREKLVGMVTSDDVLCMLVHELSNVTKAIEPVLAAKSF